MHWIFIALIAPLIWSVLNHVDKYLISSYSKDIGVAGLAIFSSLFAIFVLPIIYFFDQSVLSLPASQILALIISGIFFILCIFFYLHALGRDDASHVVPFWFLTPVFAYVLGVSFLGEYIEGGKIIGSLITLIGAVILSLEFDEGVKIKKVTAFLMILSSLSLAVADTIFKYFAANASFGQSIFWNQVGLVIFACILLLIPLYRRDFLKILKVNTKKLFMLNLGGEAAQAGASILNFYALLLAPIALVTLVNYTFQPLFVFIEGILITKFFPRIAQEHLTKRHIAQKLASILIMAAGVYLIMI